MCDKACISRKEKQVLWAILMELKGRVRALEKHTSVDQEGRRPTGAALSECAEMGKPFSTQPIEVSLKEPSSILSPGGSERSGEGSEATLTKCEGRQI